MCVCVGVLTMFVSMRHNVVTERDSEWGTRKREKKKEKFEKREVNRDREREKWIWPNVLRIRDLVLVGTASVFT